jgi:hypothetical protein
MEQDDDKLLDDYLNGDGPLEGEIIPVEIIPKPSKLPRGRPTKLTPQKHKLIELALKTAATVEQACKFAQISRNTYYDWSRKGREDEENGVDSDERKFYLMTEQAQATPAIKAGAIVMKGMADDPRLALAFLRDRYPEAYGRKAIDIRNQHSLEVSIDAGEEEESPEKKQLKAAFIIELLEKAKLRLESRKNDTPENE